MPDSAPTPTRLLYKIVTRFFFSAPCQISAIPVLHWKRLIFLDGRSSSGLIRWWRCRIRRRRRRDGSHEGQHMPWTPSPAALPRNPSGSSSRRPSPEESPAPFLTTVVIKVLSVVGILQDEVDPMVFVMKIEMTPLESCADIGGLDAQIQEIKEAVELPDLYEDIGFRHPKGVILYGEQGKIYL